MSKKTLLLGIATLLPFTMVQAIDSPFTSSPAEQYQKQVKQAQTKALNSTQANYYSRAKAPGYSDNITLLQYIAGGVDTIINYMSNTLTNLTFQPTYNIGQSIAAGTSQAITMGATDVNAAAAGITPYPTDSTPYPPTLTGQAIFNTLTTPLPANIQQAYVGPLITVKPLYSMKPCTFSTAVLSSNKGCYDPRSAETYTSNLNMNSLFGPFVTGLNGNAPQYIFAYPTNQAQTAQNYIQFAAALSEPLDLLDLSKCDDQCIQSNPAIAKYVATLRTYAAQQSAGVSTLYQLLTERALLADANGNLLGLGRLAGLPTNSPNYPEASPLQVDQYFASRRVTDPNWYTAMETSTAASIARENLYVNAESRLELFRLRMAIERLTAVIAVMQLQQLRGSQAELMDTIPNQVNFIRKNIAPYKDSSSSGSGS